MRRLIVSLTTLISAFALGKASTEYYYQPAAGADSVDLVYSMTNTPTETETALGVKTDLKSTAGDFNLRWIHGIDEKSAWGAYTFFGSRKYHDDSSGTDVTHTADGMGDFHLFYRAFSDSMWHWDADVGINTAKIKLDSTTGLTDNRTTGGSNIRLAVGKMWTDSAWNYGADLSYLLLLERTVDNAANTKLTGGDTLKLAGFGEYNYGSGFAGAEISYNLVGDLKTKTGATSSTLDGENYLQLSLYGTYDFNAMWAGLLSFSGAMHQDQDITGGSQSNAYTETIINVGARMSF